MDKFFTALNVRLAWLYRFLICRKHILSAAIVLMLAGAPALLQAQVPTFFEDFDDVPRGEVPEGWTTYSLGGASPGHNWVRTSYGFFGGPVMVSGFEYALPGQIDEDWLVTPQITPAAGDYLIFDAGEENSWAECGSTYHIRVSTATSNRADFTATLASYTEAEFPDYIYEEPIVLDLSAYEGMPIYIAFVHENPVEYAEEEPPFDSWYLDNVAVRPPQSLDYSGGEINWSYDNVIRLSQAPTSTIIGLVVRASGDYGDAGITSFTFTTEGTSEAVTIKEAILYTTHGDPFIATSEEDGMVWADLFGTVSNPGATFTIEGDQLLERGDTYFWLMYTAFEVDGALEYPYSQLDATFEKVVVNGVEHDATLRTASGSHPIVPEVPVNDNLADAIELMPAAVPVRYGSYNNRATIETDFEKLSYCATPTYGSSAADGANSVWWHFTPPYDGMITIDLSACNWNTLLVIQDEHFDQLACNKDIDPSASVFQSKITDFEVKAGQDLYIRVAGEGLGPGDPNAASGVVHLDFSYVTPVGVDDPLSPQELSALYPNPASEEVYVDLVLHRSGEVVLDVRDILGRPVRSQFEGYLPAGTYEHVALDVSSLPTGTYVVHVRKGALTSARKLIVTR